MSITLSYSSTTLTLDPDLAWTDETQWQAVEQSAQRSVTGAIIVNAVQRIKGRPITLAPVSDDSAWMTKGDVDQLRAWGDVAGRQMTLNLRGTTYTVVFRHHDGVGVDARQVTDYADPTTDDYYLVTLRFMEV